MKPRGSIPRSQGPFNIPIRNRINPVPRIGTYVLKVHSNKIGVQLNTEGVNNDVINWTKLARIEVTGELS